MTNTIEKYNNELIREQRNINIIDYINEVNKLFHKIDTSFINEFIDLISRNECCIHHNLLEKYEVISLSSSTFDIKRILDQNELIIEKDYILRNSNQFNSKEGKGKKNEYYLHPYAFKLCLIRSLKTPKYAKYYLLLEECIKYFNDYQNKINEVYIISYKNRIGEYLNTITEQNYKINSLKQKIDIIIDNNKKLEQSNRELIELTKKNNIKLDETHNMLEETNEELELTNIKLETTDKTLNIIANKLNSAVIDRVVQPIKFL
uniref:Uncharacterized protein n=1 Tax=viral metagenome TaxID=1070528 RepID=A0A6C0H8Q3_9ZZZZ